MRRAITDVLVHQATPDSRSGALIALLHALGSEHKIVYPRQYGLSMSELRARAEEVAKGNWASEAVRRAIDEMIAVVAASSSVVVVSESG